MCGRYVAVSSPTILAERFDVTTLRVTENPEPNYNVAPRAEVPVVAESSEHERVLDLVRWGLVPSWAKDVKIGDRMINARAETVMTTNAYKRAFERRRCIVPADGFYEWQRIPHRKTKQPWFFRRRDGEPLAFAGVWEIWHDPNDPDQEHAPRLRSCAIITTDANELVQPVHDRMPVALSETVWDTWLDRDNRDVDALAQMLVPAPADEMEAWPVSLLVNKADNNGPALLDRTDTEETLL